MRRAGQSTWRFWTLAWFSAVLLCQAVAIGPPHKPSPADIARAIRELGDDSFTVRERASRFLWSAGRDAEPAVLAARSSADPEVSSRAEAILEQFKWGLYPDTPSDIQKLIHEYQKILSSDRTGRNTGDSRSRVVERLREKGPPGYRALYKIALADPDGNPEIYQELLWAVHVECQKWLEACLSDVSAGKVSVLGRPGSLEGMAAALDWAPGTLADCKDSFACRFVRSKAVLGMIGGGLARQLSAVRLDSAVATGSGALETAIRARAAANPVSAVATGSGAFEAAILARAAGNPALAARFAERSGDQALQKFTLLENSDWPALWKGAQAAERAGDLTYTPLSSVRSKTPTPEDKIEEQRIVAMGERAALARRVGETRVFDSLIAQLKALDAKEPFKEKDGYRANALLGNDRIDDAIEFLKKANQREGAIELLVSQLRYREAVDLASLPDDPRVEHNWQMDLVRAGLWSTVGEPEKATHCFKKALAGIVSVGRDAEAQADWIDAVLQAGRRDLLVTEAAGWPLEDPNDRSLEALLKGLFPDNEKDANVWWRVVRVAQPGESLEKTLKRIEAVLEGRASAAEIQSYVGVAKAKLRTSVPGPTLAVISAGAYHAMGREDLAQEAVRAVDRSTWNQDELIRLGDLAAFRQDWAAAIELYDAAWRKWPGHGDNGDRVAEKRGMAALALYLEGKALAKSGQAKGGQEVMELAHWLPLADDDARSKFLGALEGRHEQEGAGREMELLSRIGEPGSVHTWLARLDLARHLAAKKDYRSAAALREQLFLERIHWGASQEFGRYLIISDLWHRNLAQEYVQAGRVKECLQEAARAEQAAPGDVDLAITLCPQLERAGEAAEANRLYSRMFERHQKLLLQYPRSAGLHNDLAWLAARSRRNLDEALSHARRAVELAPERPEFIDTLAEAQFQNGKRSEAIENARRCVRLDPRREYYKKQLARMEKGDPGADIPAAD
jgi:tetratricopeptide (TPR) repeat protein